MGLKAPEYRLCGIRLIAWTTGILTVFGNLYPVTVEAKDPLQIRDCHGPALRGRNDIRRRRQIAAIQEKVAPVQSAFDALAKASNEKKRFDTSLLKDSVTIKEESLGAYSIHGKRVERYIPPPKKTHELAPGETVASNLNGGIFFVRENGLPTVFKLGGVIDNVYAQDDSEGAPAATYNAYLTARIVAAMNGPAVYQVGWVDLQGKEIPFYSMEELFPGQHPRFFKDEIDVKKGTKEGRKQLTLRGNDQKTPLDHFAEFLVRALESGIDLDDVEFAFIESGIIRPMDAARAVYNPNMSLQDYKDAAIYPQIIAEDYLKLVPGGRKIFVNAFIRALERSTLSPEAKTAIAKSAFSLP